MVDNVEEANGFASIKHLSGHFLWVAIKVGKVNDWNVVHHDEYFGGLKQGKTKKMGGGFIYKAG